MRCPQCGASFMVRKPGDTAPVGATEPDNRGAGLPAVSTGGGVGLPSPSSKSTGMGLAAVGASLPVPKDLAAGLPMPREFSAGLPALASQDVSGLPATRNEFSGLPSLRADVSGLPSPRGDVSGLPSPRGDVSGLPSPRGDVSGLPSPRGDVSGLPSPISAGLPSPINAGLPSPLSAGLPSPVGAGLPSPVAGGLPVPRDSAGLPMTAAGLPAAAASLPYPSQSSGLPANAAALPVTMTGQAGLPVATAALPLLAEPSGSGDEHELAIPDEPPSKPPPDPDLTPTHGTARLGRIGLERKAFTVSAAEDLPSAVARANRGARRDPMDLEGYGGVGRSTALTGSPALADRPPTAAPPTPSPQRSLTPSAIGGMDFGEIDLGAADVSGGSLTSLPPPAFGAQPDMAPLPSFPSPAPGSDFGGELDSIPKSPKADEKRDKKQTKAFREIKPDTTTPVDEDKHRSRRMLAFYITLGVVSMVIVGGAALSTTEYGAFGRNFFDEKIHGPERHAAAERVILMVDRSLEQDTYERAVAGLRRLDQAMARVPLERELKAYAVYANNLVVARFGVDPTRVGRARSLLAEIADAPPSMHYVTLARASDAYARGSYRDVARLVSNDPQGRDLATLGAFAQGDLQNALRLARNSRQRHPTPRSRYLLIRALYETDDVEGAQREAEEALRLAPDHVGTRTILARLLGRSPQSRERALSLLRGIVRDEGPSAAPARNSPALLVASPSERAEAGVVAGQVEFARDHVSQALARYQRALELDPRSAPALVGLGLILYRQGNFTDALARFRNAANADHQNIDAVIGVAQSCLALNQHADARAAIEPALAAHTNDDRLHYWLGRALMGTADRQNAEREFREAIRLQPGNLEAYVSLSELLIVLQRPDAAEQVLMEARQRVPDGAAIHRALAHGRLARGDMAGAEAELHVAIEREPDDMRAHFALGEVYRQMGQSDDQRRDALLSQAEHEFELVSRGDPNYPGLAMVRGQIAEARGQLPEALNTFREQLVREPLNIELRTRVASILVALGNYGEAAQNLSSVVVDHPTHAEAQFFMGRAKLGAENYTDAMRYFDRAIELNPQRADFKAYAAEANFRLGNIVRARQLAEQSIELDPNFPRGYWVRAAIRVHHGEAVPALEDIAHATRLDARLWAAYATWAEIDEVLGHPRESIVLYRRALAADAHHGDWYYNLGRLLADDGASGEARAAFEHARNLGASLSPPPTWFIQSTRALADLLRESSPGQARPLYEEFLRMVPPGSASAISVQSILYDMAHS